MEKDQGRVTGIADVTNEDLAWKVTLEAGPDGEGYVVWVSLGRVSR